MTARNKTTPTFTPDFNLLPRIRLFTVHDLHDAEALARELLPSGAHDDEYWYVGAISVTTAVILHLCYRAHAESREATREELITSFSPASFPTTLRTAAFFPHDAEYRAGWTTAENTPTPTHPLVQVLLQDFAKRSEPETAGILAQVNSSLSPDPYTYRLQQAIRRANKGGQRYVDSFVRRKRARRANASKRRKETA